VAVLAGMEHVRRGRNVGRRAELGGRSVLRDPDHVALLAQTLGFGQRLGVGPRSKDTSLLKGFIEEGGILILVRRLS
jgi:hypothetical protein